MDGIHDLGGMEGFGAVRPERDEPTFHHPWEALAFRLNTAAIGWLKAYNADEYRHAVERLDPAYYLTAPYYERMLTAIISLLLEKNVLQLEALQKRAAGQIPLARPTVPNPEDNISDQPEATFAIGDTVRVRDRRSPGHTRAPGYARGRTGIVVHIAPAFGYPDPSAHGLPPRLEPTLHVAFDAKNLWGTNAEANNEIIVDLWQSYLEPAP